MELPPLPDSLPSTPLPKRGKTEPSLSEMQDNIVRLLSEKINQCADGLENMIRQNTVSIEALKKTSEFLFKEVNDMKNDVQVLKKSRTEYETKMAELIDKVNEAERYQRRWNLRLYGLMETEDENLKQKVREICCNVIPEAKQMTHYHLDVAHRVGKKDGNQPRAVIIRFSSRSTKELVWKKAKKCDFLHERKLRFGEDLTMMDRASRNRLWPRVEEARNLGKNAFFVVARAFVEGKEIK